MDYIAQPKDYWIAQQAIDITLNALDNPNRINGTLLTGAAILCYIDGVEGLDYDAGHHFKTWPLAFSPTRFNNNNVKYVYVAIPRTEQIGTQAVVVFPEEQLDVYGMNASDEQVGSADYYYIWLQGVISDTDGTTPRTWSQQVDFGKKGTDEDLYDFSETDWYIYSKVTNSVTFLKKIVMQAGSYFQNIFLGSRELTGVATGATTAEYVDSEVLVATPSYIKANYLSKKSDDVAEGNMTFEQNVDVGGDASVLGTLGVNGNATIDGILQALAKILSNKIESDNFSGDWQDAFGAGFQLQKSTNGITSMVVDNLFVRMKAIFTELEIRKISYAGGNIIFSHAGSKIVKVEPLYSEYYLYIPDGTYDERHEGIILDNGKYIPAEEGLDLETAYLVPTDNAVITAYRCYIMKDDGTTATENWWKVNDQARCQTFNVVDPGNYQQAENTYYWRRVIEVGTEELEDADGRKTTYDYVDLSAIDCAANSDAPKAGDQIVQMGNRGVDAEGIARQGFITIEVSGENAPAFKVYKGVSGYTLENKRKICLSPSLTDLHVQKLTIETDYGVSARVPVERGNWSDITDHKCYYYDLVQDNGSTWLCVVPEGTYTTDRPSSSSNAWQVYAQKGQDGIDGKSFSILGSYDTYAELIAAHPTGDVGDAYMVGGDLYVWDAENNEWHNSGQIKGEDGNNYVSVYTLADSQPAAPSGSSVPPTGWFTNIPQLNSVSAAGDFSEDNGWRKASGNHVENAFIKDTLTFTTTQPNQKVFIQIRPSSEEIYDIIAVGLLDTDLANRAAVTALDASRKTSGTTPKTVVTTVATAGQHTLCIVYSKDESEAEGEDSAWYRVTPVDVYISTAAFKNNTIQGTWSNPTRFSANSEDSVSVLLSPGTLLVNQDMEDLDNLSDLSEDVFVSVYKGAVPQVITNITKTGTTHCNASVGSNYVRLTAVLTDANNKYYDNGSIAFNVTFRDSDTGELKTITGVIIRFNANLLGSWSQKVEGDMETIIAQKTTYIVDGNTYTVQNDLGTFVKSSTENISTLTSQMNNGKNLLSGVLTGTGWKSASSTTPSTLHDITVDSDGWFNAYGTDSYMISPAFRINNGQKYVFSYYQSALGNNYVYVKYYDSANSQWVQFARVYTTGSDLRKSITFTGTSEVVGKDLYIFIYRKPITRPQLEFGEVATAFSAGTTETTSEIKQTASEINLSVRGDVAGTNINLLYGVDGYTSSNKLVHKMKAADGAIEYGGDNGHPHIFSSVQLVKGCTYTIQCVTDGNIASSHSTSGIPSSKLCTIWLRMDGTLNGGYNGECFTSQYSGYENLGNGRHKWTFVCKKTGEYWFRTNSYSDGTTEVTINFWNIKLEGGSDATAFTASTSQMASQINQTANSIELNVKNGLKEVGISILGGSNKVVAKAGIFEVQNNSGTKTFEIDSDGNLQGSGNAAFKGTIKSGQYTESGQTKYANQINDDGSGQLAKGGISWDVAGNTTFEGNIKAQGGTIGGFKINQSDLENTDYGAGITIQNAASNPTKEVKIGADATDSLTGRKAAMVAKATEANTSSDRPYNTALFLQAKNAKYNYAVHGEGNNVLNGYTQGYKVKVLNNIGITTNLSLNDGKVQAIASVNTNSDKNIYLPTLGDCCKTLGIDDSNTSAITDFCCEMTIINQSAIQTSTPYNRDNVYIRGDNHAYNAQITSLTARPVVLAQGNPKYIELNNCTTCNIVITYINKRFIANYVKTVW